MVRNPCVWPAPMNKMAGTPLGKMADQTIVESVHNSDHGAFASGASCGGSLKESDSSPLVSPTAIINMSRGQFNVDVAATFGVSLTNVSDLDVLIKDIEDGNHEELLSGMTNNMREATMDALVLLWLKNLNVDESLIVQSVSIQDKHGSYIATAGGSRPKPSATGGSKLDPCISKANFRLLFLENLCEGVYVSIRRKVVETVFLEDGLSNIASQIGKPIMLDSYTSSMVECDWVHENPNSRRVSLISHIKGFDCLLTAWVSSLMLLTMIGYKCYDHANGLDSHVKERFVLPVLSEKGVNTASIVRYRIIHAFGSRTMIKFMVAVGSTNDGNSHIREDDVIALK
ncbi:hypothetical protein Tco_0381890 [Tanacetum coccineum]